MGLSALAKDNNVGGTRRWSIWTKHKCGFGSTLPQKSLPQKFCSGGHLPHTICTIYWCHTNQLISDDCPCYVILNVLNFFFWRCPIRGLHASMVQKHFDVSALIGQTQSVVIVLLCSALDWSKMTVKKKKSYTRLIKKSWKNTDSFP